MQGSTVMRQRHAETLAPEEPDELIAHVRVCGGAGWVTTGSTRKPTASSFGSALLRLRFWRRLTPGVRLLKLHCMHCWKNVA
jgi:hypothetical protein